MNQLVQSCRHPHQAQVQRRSRQVLRRPCPDLPWRNISDTNKRCKLRLWRLEYQDALRNGSFRFARSLTSKYSIAGEASLRSSLSKHFLSSQKAWRSTTLPSWRIYFGDIVHRWGCLDQNSTINCLYSAYAHEMFNQFNPRHKRSANL